MLGSLCIFHLIINLSTLQNLNNFGISPVVTTGIYFYVNINTVNFLSFRTPGKLVVINLKFVQRG